LLGSEFFLGTVLLGGPLSSKGIPMRVDDFGFVAGAREAAARSGFGSGRRGLRFTGALLELGLARELRLCALLPISDQSQIAGAHQSLFQSRALGVGEICDLSFSVAPYGLGAICRDTRRGCSLHALAERPRVALDALLPQPMQGLERVPVPHAAKSSKASRVAGNTRISRLFSRF